MVSVRYYSTVVVQYAPEAKDLSPCISKVIRPTMHANLIEARSSFEYHPENITHGCSRLLEFSSFGVTQIGHLALTICYGKPSYRPLNKPPTPIFTQKERQPSISKLKCDL